MQCNDYELKKHKRMASIPQSLFIARRNGIRELNGDSPFLTVNVAEEAIRCSLLQDLSSRPQLLGVLYASWKKHLICGVEDEIES